MPPAIIAPSVLASDFGQLTAECKRMINGGAQWLHMGQLSTLQMALSFLSGNRCYGWVIYYPVFQVTAASLTVRSSELHSHFVPNITMGVYLL